MRALIKVASSTNISPRAKTFTRLKARGGHALVSLIGVMVTTMMTGVLAIDMPVYFNAQNQLQTAVNAAAIAGAYELPVGTSEAEQAAYEIAAQNPVAGQSIPEGNLHYAYGNGSDMTMIVDGKMAVPTILGKMVCTLSGGKVGSNNGWSGNDEGGVWDTADEKNKPSPCNPMFVAASAKAVPAARDTILVIDTSSSMIEGVQPFKAVKTAAKQYVTMVEGFDNSSVDRIAVVDFNRFGFKKIGLTAKRDYSGNGFGKVRSTIDALKTYSSSTPGYVGGWNTNYYVGLKEALDEIQRSGRQNAKRNIVFLTDGKPNLPAPPSYYSRYGASEYRMCSDPVHNSQTVKNLNYTQTVSGKKRYYTWSLPYTLCYKINNTGTSYCNDNLAYNQHAIKHSHIAAVGADKCTQTYVNHMTSTVEGQIARAKTMGVTIHTIEIYDPELGDGNANDYLARLLTDLAWDPDLVEQIAAETNGQTYAAETSDTSGIVAIYEQIAKDVKVKLAY